MTSRFVDRNHDHKYKGVYIKGAVKLVQDDKHSEFSMKLRGLYTEKKKVDPTCTFCQWARAPPSPS